MTSQRSNPRFSLLLLEDQELYLEDFGCTFWRGDKEAKKLKGRLRLCSRSLFFDPENWEFPIVRVPLNRVQQVGQQGDNVCVVRCTQQCEMKRGGRDHPFVFFDKQNAEIAFVLDYHSDPAGVLLRISTILQNAKGEKGFAGGEASLLRAKRLQAKPFLLTSLVSLNEEVLGEWHCSRVRPFVLEPCRVVVSSLRMYLQPVDDIDGLSPVFELSAVRKIFRRRHAFRNVGLELLFSSGDEGDGSSSLFLSFVTEEEREMLYNMVLLHPVVSVALDKDTSEEVTRKWQRGEVSNFQYLMYLNNLADRTTNDLAQYPVFPWIIADYESTELDLKNPATYRDLTKAVGALNSERLRMYCERMADMEQDNAFLYGTHYSTPGYVLFYLVRKRPDLMLHLQNGKFDAADRSFYSIAATWLSCSNSPTDVKELIPEFFCDPSFLVNKFHLDLGDRQNGSRVNDVELPPWAKGDARLFVQKNLEALESPYVSERLHHWIDLVFGYKQRGEEAKRAHNLFHPVTYGRLDLQVSDDPLLQRSLEVQIAEFGQTPRQVFTRPHPKRGGAGISAFSDDIESSVSSSSSSSRLSVSSSVPKHQRLQSLEVINLDELLGNPVVIRKGSGGDSRSSSPFTSCSWDMKAMRASTTTPFKAKFHREAVTGLAFSRRDELLVSVSRDGLLKAHNIKSREQYRSSTVTRTPLSCCTSITDDVVLVGSCNGRLELFNVEFNRSVFGLSAHDDAVTCASYVPSLGQLVTGGRDTLVKVWNVSQGSIDRVAVGEICELNAIVTGVDFAQNGVFVASGDDGGAILGDVRAPGMFVRTVLSGGTEVAECARLLDDRRAVFGNRIAMLDRQDDFEPFLDGASVKCVALNGSMGLVGASDVGTVSAWDFSSREPKECDFRASVDSVTCLLVGDKGLPLFVGQENGNIMWFG